MRYFTTSGLRFLPSMTFSVAQACLCLAATLSALTILSDATQGQELRKALNDYRNERPFNYQPSDPFVRSKAFQVQTKHYGLFYNCDNEECKRNSPYICWKTHYEKDFPTTMSVRERIRHEVAQVKQRILDGAGMCAAGCDCQQCQTPSNQGGCQCSECSGGGDVLPHGQIMPIEVAPSMGGMYLGKANLDRATAKANEMAAKNLNRFRSTEARTESTHEQTAGGSYGLVSGGRSSNGSPHLIRDRSSESQKPVRVAEQVDEKKEPSLLERFRQLNR